MSRETVILTWLFYVEYPNGLYSRGCDTYTEAATIFAERRLSGKPEGDRIVKKPVLDCRNRTLEG